ncbi:MAG: trehalose operon repressor [Fusobacteriia bacterium 4572_74]|nr:MAG: trehalose operon repressor [Fusobacteriia bacterium 4572_74]
MKKLTIFDVAKKSGVGKSTVSRVLNHDQNVKEETREKVLKVINEMNYKPSISARGMRSNNSRVIGIITSRLDSSSEAQAVRGMLEIIYSMGYDVVLAESLFDREKTKEHIEMFMNKKVEGIILFATSGVEYNYLKKIKVPVIMMGQEVKGFTSIVYDDYGAVEKILKEFQNMGLKKIGYMGVDLSDRTTGYRRYQAYEKFVNENNMKNISAFGDFTYKKAYELTEVLMEHEIDAIVCATDNLVLGVRKYLLEKHIENIVVSGIGKNELLSFLYKNHITVNLSYKKSGIEAGKMIFKMLSGVSTDEKIVMESHLVKGE